MAQANEADKKTLAGAEAALQNKQPAEALNQLRSVKSDAQYAAAAHTLAERARDMLAESSLIAARAACRKGEWKTCHEHATTVLEHRPDSTEGRAFVSEAENAMRARRIPYTPWSRPVSASPGGGGGTLESMYGDAKVRDAAARYAAGDLETAIQWARTYTSRTGASKLSQGLVAFRRAKTAGDGAAIAGDVDRAVAAWEEALTADAAILPSGHPSVLRDQVRRRMGLELFRKGDAAFDRAIYPEAYRHWSLGLRHNPDDPELRGGVERLEKRAAAALESVPNGSALGADDCNALAEILAMTSPTSDVHGAAQQRRQKFCRR
jgi:tetratricopeptide (TPR) repeat protein